MSGLLTVGYFLVSLFFSLLLFALWIRVALRYFRVSLLHPVGHLIYGLTNPIVQPLERLVYRGKPVVKQYDWVTLGLIFIVELLQFFIIGLIFHGILLPFTYLVIFALADSVIQLCNLLFYIILIRVVMSWVNPAWQHPALDIMKLITDPLLDLGRRIIPDISGFDFSPFIIMILLKVIALFMEASLPFRI
ncbi:YggT family protein [Legionella jordanis]|uniref:YggT family protein n=1 Tax=Legionella jordanis TaxID=456 RepID=A0A0W0VA58_9GAMM|nr:YggT family protein [Legionella jordanis]KTD16749.1 YggT family protein [Legionella jordanis]RMX03723.1 YggT family protein [Legionella jordanis]RMX22215.1 YggT family protein [Legionella jordanis]VEH11783.1 Integral membrane protein YggT, involved in response to extracytoplasmic stress (osmotic shock) [Legionella jordanis]HAT8712907.1 YggT family protein [Legionella jordanis]